MIKMNEDMVKQRVCVTISKELLEWVEKQIEKGVFASKSHAITRALIELKKRELT